ncbi:MAG: response regulator transcription factor [Deinococcales bacterium]|nr:response regulator transcription factor [Deinococcales bacterium]
MTRLLLCDDHAMFRQGLKSILETEEDFRVIGEASTGREAVRYALETRPDVVLMDIQMPELDGVAATKAILAEQPDIPVIILTMYRQDRYVFEAVKVGARGYMLKDAGADELVDSIRRVAAGETLLNAEMAASILEEFHKLGDLDLPSHPEHTISELTEREEDILRLLAQGSTNQEIADALGVSEKTVRNRLSEIFSKLRLNNRTQAALYALREGIATLQDGNK